MTSKEYLLVFILAFIPFSLFAQDEDQSAPLDMFDWKPMVEAQQLAAEDGKKVLIYGNARWCTYCKKMEKEVFSLNSIQELTKKHFYPVWLDIESQDSVSFRGNTMTQRQLAQGFQITGTPTFIFLDSEGEVIAGQPGYIPEDLYQTILKFVGTDAYLNQSFTEFSGTSSN
ncbi:MAG: thioredoxin fold domain-containing protein [Gracilimonas sp.]|nr:thioredoxin fold domain-containing protein [Gracilimonas sp.]